MSSTPYVSSSVKRARSAKTARTKAGRRLALARSPTRYVRTPMYRSLGLSKAGFPDKLQMKLRYVETIAVSTTGASLTTHQWRCNGLYDPYVTGTGHQPLYFDQLMGMYNHYVVQGSRATFHLMPNITTGVDQQTTGGLNTLLRGCVWINDDSTITPASLDNMLELHGSEGQFFSFAANDSKKVSMNWSARNMFGPAPLANSNLRGSAASDPSEQALFAYTVQAPSVKVADFFLTVEIEYVAVFFELKDIASS